MQQRKQGKKARKLTQKIYTAAGGNCEECGAPASIDGSVYYRGRAVGGRWLCPECDVTEGKPNDWA